MSIFSNKDSYRIAWRGAKEKTPLIPLNIDIELSSLCNLKCPFCFISDPSFKRIPKKLMSFNLAQEIIDQADEIGVPALKFNWRGEPTTHPFFSVILAYAENKRSFLDLIVNTNGNCNEKAISGLMKCTKVIVSIDSLYPETYAKSRVGGSLDKAKETISTLIKEGHRNVHARRVITKMNEHEPFTEMVKQEWGEQVNPSEHYCFDRNKTESNIPTNTENNISKRIYCGYPSQRLVVAVDGYIYPCCVDYMGTMPVGSMQRTKLIGAWHSANMNIMRKHLKKGVIINETCRQCTSWAAYDAEQTKQLER